MSLSTTTSSSSTTTSIMGNRPKVEILNTRNWRRYSSQELGTIGMLLISEISALTTATVRQCQYVAICDNMRNSIGQTLDCA